jgi:arylformamidase
VAVYRTFQQADLDIQYTARTGAPNWESFVRECSEESARVRAAFGHIPDVPYGPHRAERLDVFPTTKGGAPIVVFIHGGYWRMLSKDDVSCFAATFVPAGAVFVAVNYSLAPKASIDRIVEQNRAALAWIYKNAQAIGGDRERIYVNGRSAGGHLVGMMLSTDWVNDYGLPANLIKGACAVSGLYDLEPVRLSQVNEWAQLDAGAAHRNSPIHHLPDVGCPLIVSYGTNETSEFQRQSTDYAAAWQTLGHHALSSRYMDAIILR